MTYDIIQDGHSGVCDIPVEMIDQVEASSPEEALSKSTKVAWYEPGPYFVGKDTRLQARAQLSGSVEDLWKASVCVYAATEKGPADDISQKLRWAALRIEQLERALRRKNG